MDGDIMSLIIERILEWLRSLFWKKEMELTLVGLGLTGKTSFLDVISTGSFSDDTIPTIGFNMRKFKKGNVAIKVWDVGGSPKNRELWRIYCRNVNVIVYMVDASNDNRLQASRDALHTLLDQPRLEGIPILVLGNKNDIPHSLDENDIVEKMNLSAIQDRKICCHTISCKEKENIEMAIRWLISHSNPVKFNQSRSSFYFKCDEK